MERCVEIYNSDDAAALINFYADSVVTSSDGRAGVRQGKETVLAGSIRQMARTEGLRIHPLYSYEEGTEAYQMGRFTIRVDERPTTGAYLFMFRQDQQGQWRLRFA